MYETLKKYADDSWVEIDSFEKDKLILKIEVDSRGGEILCIKFEDTIRVDITCGFTLGHVDFGGAELLPTDYLEYRNQGYDGDEEKYFVARFTDIDENLHFIISYKKEIIYKENST